MEVFIGMSHEQELNGKGWDASAFLSSSVDLNLTILL